MDRIILHCDCNCFYASCELLSHPDLRQLPVAVCGDPTERHGIILAKNEPAKRCGVKTAETIWKAKQKCPGLILLPPQHRLYAEYSKKINAVYGEYTDLVEPFGIDESWLDVTNSLHLFGGDARALADTLRGRIKREFGLTISVGVSFNKVFAKLGSDYKKPDATTVIARDNWRDIVFPLPVGDLLFVGRSAQELLGRYGVRTIGELSKCSEEMLETLMGKMGSQLYRYANGLDDSPVRGAADREPIKSVGNSTTFRRDLTRWDEVQSGISLLSDSVAMRLRRYGLYCGGVQVGIKNSRFQVFSRQTTLDHSTHLMREINDTALRLAKDLWKAPDPIRLLSVTALHLTEEAQSYRQLDLLGTDDTQQEKQEAVDAIKGNYAFEKDAEYQRIGNYLHPSQVIEKNLHRSYLRFQVDENGVMSMTSIYCGPHNIHHLAVKVTAPDGSFAETPASKDSYETTDLGEKIEKADYKVGEDGNVIAFLNLNKDKNIRVNYLGERSYATTMTPNDRKAVAAVYELAQLLSAITEIKKNKDEANLKIEFVKRKMAEREGREKE